MDFQDKNLVCRDCGVQFIWTAGEQAFFAQKGFTNPPTRCPECRKKNKAGKPGGRVDAGPAVLTDITCKSCGKTTQAPFQPKNPHDILCVDCFEKQLASQDVSDAQAQ